MGNYGGTYLTEGTAPVKFTLPEFCPHSEIEWQFHVESAGTEENYDFDIIIGEDLIDKLGIKLDYAERTVSWNDIERPMKPVTEDTPKISINMIHDHERESKHLRDSLDDFEEKLEVEYKKANLEKVVKDMTYLTKKQQKKMLVLMKKYEDLFDGTLGEFKNKEFDVNLKEDAPSRIVHRSFPVPRVREEKFKDELSRLCGLGVLRKLEGKEVQRDYAFPAFTVLKKDPKFI